MMFYIFHSSQSIYNASLAQTTAMLRCLGLLVVPFYSVFFFFVFEGMWLRRNIIFKEFPHHSFETLISMMQC